MDIQTKFLVLSDTHGEALLAPSVPIDVVIHCGDLTEESKIEEIKASIKLLKEIDAPLKLVIAGNHDFTLDLPAFKKKLADHNPPLDAALVKLEYGDFGEARALLDDAKQAGVVFLDEGTHNFTLANGAALTVYASPYTPSLSEGGFQYKPKDEHEWAIGTADVVITHGPPRGILDYTDSKERAGSPSLFAAVARAQPRMHCFGHIHEGWGAKQVTWRSHLSELRSHFTDIDNDSSTLFENLATIHPRKYDSADDVAEKRTKLEDYTQKRYCKASPSFLQPGNQTLFVNAAIEGTMEHPRQLPWLIDIDLPNAQPSLSHTRKRKGASEMPCDVEKPAKRTDLHTEST
ncbi:hypothetical protein LTR08_002959 [Meristemomyces frigidus]|nr:hypothetical protein LTR08_002959 [Meristemomyces frigidus]